MYANGVSDAAAAIRVRGAIVVERCGDGGGSRRWGAEGLQRAKTICVNSIFDWSVDVEHSYMRRRACDRTNIVGGRAAKANANDNVADGV